MPSTTCQLASTACNSVARRSSNSGMATTLDAKIGAAMRLPSASQISNSQPSRASTTCRKKSDGVSMGTGASNVISAAEVITHPVAASASKAPNCTMHQ
ncbi:hypothetical protein D3C87_1738330 [compost metagenome]